MRGLRAAAWLCTRSPRLTLWGPGSAPPSVTDGQSAGATPKGAQHLRPRRPAPAGQASHVAKPRVDKGWRSRRSVAELLAPPTPPTPSPTPHPSPPASQARRPRLTSCHGRNVPLPCTDQLSGHPVNEASLLPPRDLASVSPWRTAGPEQEPRCDSHASTSPEPGVVLGMFVVFGWLDL